MRIVLKFGGTSLSDEERLLAAARKVAEQKEAGHQVVVVVSAQADTTDRLLAVAEGICAEPSKRELDAYLSTGEQMSAALMALTLQRLGWDAVSLTGMQAGIVTDSVYGNARVLGLRPERILQEWEAGKIVVIAGFQGVNGSADITTLGRGGSDTTAVALAAFLKADVCRIYTDVDGVYDKDPRKYPDAVKYDTISYEQMLAMAANGAQVLHERCVELAMLYRVTIQVLSSFRPGEGTYVTDALC